MKNTPYKILVNKSYDIPDTVATVSGCVVH